MMKKNEFLYFALRNIKLQMGLAVVLFFVILTFIGPWLAKYPPLVYNSGPIDAPPSPEHWFGTTTFGQDIFSQFVHGLSSTFLVGIVGGGLGTLIGLVIGFTAGYRGGLIDELLSAFTNIILVIPTLALLILFVTYLGEILGRSVLTESIFIGFTAWPWTARAVRSQTFSLRARDFVDLAKLSGVNFWKIIFTEIAPNMMSYLFMVFILQFGGAILIAASLDFIGLGPTEGISLGLMMNNAFLWSPLILGKWWWFVPPGLAITAIVGAMYIMDVGLDEVFNPKLREM